MSAKYVDPLENHTSNSQQGRNTSSKEDVGLDLPSRLPYVNIAFSTDQVPAQTHCRQAIQLHRRCPKQQPHSADNSTAPKLEILDRSKSHPLSASVEMMAAVQHNTAGSELTTLLNQLLLCLDRITWRSQVQKRNSSR